VNFDSENAINRKGNMTTKTRYSGKLIALAAATCALSATAYAEIVYDNSNPKSYQGQWFNAGVEFGDQVNLAGTGRLLTDFKVDYYLSPSANGNEVAQVRFYANDGVSNGQVNGTPGTLLFDSGTFALSSGDAKGFNTIDISGLEGVTVSDSFTWTILFGGIDPIEQAGVLFYNPPTVGSSYDDFWARSTDGAWALNTFPSVNGKVANFGAQVTAIPEPGTVALAVVGGLIWLGVAARRRNETQ